MHSRKLEQLTANELAVIEYLYGLSNPPPDPLPLEDRAVRGLTHFLLYVAEVAAHEPDMLTILEATSLQGELGIYRTEDALMQHVLEVVMQKVLVEEDRASGANPYVTPLIMPPAHEGEAPVAMARFTLYMHLIAVLFGGIEGVNNRVVMATRGPVRKGLMSAIRKHYARQAPGRRKP